MPCSGNGSNMSAGNRDVHVPFSAARRVIAAGDWGCNTPWALQVIRQVPEILAGEDTRVILHAGDFAVWPGREDYLSAVSAALSEVGAVLCFVDGNHEDHKQLAALRQAAPGQQAPVPVPAGSGPPRIFWLPRGFRWNWHGRIWLALGGGVSFDRAVKGDFWWPEEEITGEQADAAAAAGHADVMLTHDCPAGVVHTFPPPPSFWDLRDIRRSEDHRRLLQHVVAAVQPAHLIHGHLHIGYQRITDFGYGAVQVTGLANDEAKWNYAVLDTSSMTWEAP